VEATMNVTITSRHLNIGEELKNHIHERIEKLSKYYDKVFDVHVILKNEKYRKIAEFNARIYGTDLHAREVSNDLLTSVDGAIDKLEIQIKKLKGKVKNHKGIQKEELLVERRMEQEALGEGEFGDTAYSTDEISPESLHG
jgi:putative sigma-54 modulation protein